MLLYFDRIGKRQSHGQRQALGYGDDQNCHTDDQEFHKTVEILIAPRLLLINELGNAKVHNEDDNRKNGDGRT